VPTKIRARPLVAPSHVEGDNPAGKKRNRLAVLPRMMLHDQIEGRIVRIYG
jgi:hypothetical protein